MTDRPERPVRDGLDPAALGLSVLLAGWFVLSAANNVPVRGYDRMRRTFPVFNLWVPNWRFFSPNPIKDDSHLVYRVVDPDGQASPWMELELIARPRWSHVLVQPARRRLKALHDVVTLVLDGLQRYPRRIVENGSHYRVLQGFVRNEVARRHPTPQPRGFQFAVLRYSGYDDDHDPDYQLLSAYEPVQAPATAAV